MPAALAVVLAASATPGMAEVIWNGSFSEHDFLSYHHPGAPDEVRFFFVPEYGRPAQHGAQKPMHVGNGELLSLVDSPTRGSKYSAKFMVKSQASGGVEPRDCDPASGCSRRRSQLQMTSTFLDYYDAIPQGAERWVSFSIYLPEDFDASGKGFGPVIWGSKSSTQDKPGAFGLQIKDNESWELIHRYYSARMHESGVDFKKAWWLSTYYSKDFPSRFDWAQGLVDFPDENLSRAALANLNRGGWTDFIWHFRTDIDEFESNTGFLDVYMRAGSGPWVHVLHVLPMKDLARNPRWVENRPERVYDRGIGQYGPGGYTSAIGLYMDKRRVWGHPKSMIIYVDNYKVGNERATFEMMTHDGSSHRLPLRPQHEEYPRKRPKLVSFN